MIGVVRVRRVIGRVRETGRIVSSLMSRTKSSRKTTSVVRELAHITNISRSFEHRKYSRSSSVQYVARSLRNLRSKCFRLCRGDGCTTGASIERLLSTQQSHRDGKQPVRLIQGRQIEIDQMRGCKQWNEYVVLLRSGARVAKPTVYRWELVGAGSRDLRDATSTVSLGLEPGRAAAWTIDSQGRSFHLCGR